MSDNPVVQNERWAEPGNMMCGVPGRIQRLLAQGTKAFGYAPGDGASMVFRSEHGPVSVLPGQWVNKHADGTFSVTDKNPLRAECEEENPDYPGEYHCTYPPGHGPVSVEGEEGDTWDHGSTKSGVVWNMPTPADPGTWPDSEDSLEDVKAREFFVAGVCDLTLSTPEEAGARWDLWVARHDAEVKGEALRVIEGLVSRTSNVSPAMGTAYRHTWQQAVANAVRVIQEAAARG